MASKHPKGTDNRFGDLERRPRRGRGGGAASRSDVEKLSDLETEGAEPEGGLAPFESDEQWSSGEVSMDSLASNGGEVNAARRLDELTPIGELGPDWTKEQLVQKLMAVGLEPLPEAVLTAITDRAVIEEGGMGDLEEIHQRIREFADVILGAEKPKTYWEKLAQPSSETQELIQRQWDRVDMLVPDFVLNNLEKLGDGETKIWREPGTIAVFDLSGFTRKAEQMMQSEDEQKTGSGSQQLNAMIGRCFGTIHGEASAAGGELISLGGDEVVYMFTEDSHAERALHFASRVQSHFTHSAGIKLKGGVASGDLLMGAIKLDEKRSLPVVLGAPVVGARNMERLALKGDVMVHSGLTGLMAEHQRIKKDMGLALQNFEALEAVGEFARNHPHIHADGVTLEKLKQAETFLHPHLRYVGEHQGIAKNLYDGERPAVTVAFADMDIEDIHRQIIREVGEEASTVDSPALAKLEQVLQMSNRSARKYHGTMEKFILSDTSKIMVIFTRGERLAANGLRWAKEVQRGLQQADIDSAMGVKSGVGYRGITGASEASIPKVELGFIGDPANWAARLSARAERGVVLTDTRTATEASEVLRVDTGRPRNQKAMGLKGLESNATVVQIERIESVESTLEHMTTGRAVGREHQKQMMQEAWQRMLKTGEQVVETIVAEAGEGKSLLTDEIVREHYFEKRDATVLKGKAGEFSADDVYSLWRLPARKLFGIEEGDETKVVLNKITAKLLEVNSDYDRYAELFAEQFNLAPINVPDDQHFAGFGGKAAEVLGVLIGKQSDELPTMVVMEDLHWADQASKELLKLVMQNTKRDRVLFHLVARPTEDLMEFFRLDADQTYKIELGPLERENWSDFVATQFPILGMQKLADYESKGDTSWRKDRDTEEFHLMQANDRLAEATYKVSGGNPYIGRRLIHYLLNYHELNPDKINPKTGKPFMFFEESDSGVYQWGDYIDYSKLGEVSKLMDIVSGQMLDSMQSVNERACFKFAAKFGREFTEQEVADITGINPRQVAEFSERWKRLGFIEVGAEQYSFAHANLYEAVENNIAEVALEDAGGNLRILTDAELSRLVGEYKEKHGGRLEDLARLFGAGDDIAKGMKYNLQWGDVSFGRQDIVSYRLAVTAYNRTIDLFNTNFVPMTGEDLDEEKIKQNIQREERWRTFTKPQKRELVNALLQAHCRLAKTHARVGLGNERREDALRAIDDGQQRLEQYREILGASEGEHMEIQMATIKADLLVRMSRYSEARRELDGVAGLIAQLENGEQDRESTLLLANFYDADGLVLSRTEKLDEAMVSYERALELVSEDGKDLAVFDIWSRVIGHKVAALDASGLEDEAHTLSRYALEQEEKNGYWAGAAITRIRLADRMMKGNLAEVEEARELIKTTIALVRDHAPAFEINALRVWENIEETLRNYPQAAKIIDQFVPMIGGHWGRSDYDRRINNWKVARALLAARMGDLGRAEVIIEEISLDHVSARTRAILMQTEALLVDMRGDNDPEVVEAKYKQCVAEFKTLNDSVDVASALSDFADFQYRNGLVNEAVKSQRQVIVLYHRAGEVLEEERAKNILEKM